MRPILLAVLLGLLSHWVMAESPAIRGRILDKDNAPVPFVNVLVMNPADSALVKAAVTDTTGWFIIDNLADGSYLLSITSIGYNRKIIPIQFGPAQDRPPLDIILEASAANLQEVVVRSKKPLIEVQPDRIVLNVENSIVATGNNALEVLSRAPGILVTPQDQISVRGKSGVLILIDNRPTNLSMADVIDLLRSMQSTEIEKIEVINNPPAKYDAAGTSGIINIKTIKGKNYGTSATATMNVTRGRFLRGVGGLNLQHNGKKIALNANLNLAASKQQSDWEGTNYYKTDGRISQILRSQRPEIYTRRSLNTRIGLDYYLNPKTTLGLTTRLVVGGNGLLDNTLTRILTPENVLNSTIRKHSVQDGNSLNSTSNLNLRHVVSAGHEITADLDYTYFSESNLTNIRNDFFTPEGQTGRPPLLLQNRPATDIHIGIVKADYIRPVSKQFSLEAGVKTSLVRAANKALFLENQQNVWTSDVNRTNSFLYNEHIAAGYASLQGSLKTWQIKAGLRGEYTAYEGTSLTAKTTVSNQYFQLFPSVFVNKSLNDKNSIGLSYSRRIDRPSYQSLNPFVYVSDIYTQSVGNPYLQPQLTNAFELNYTLADRYVMALSYQRTSGTIMQVLQRDAKNPDVIIWTEANLDNSFFYGLSLMVPVNLTRWWSVENSLLLNYNDMQTTLSDGRQYRLNRPSLAYNFNHSFKLSAGFAAELSGYYNSATVYGVYSVWPQYQLNFGVKKSSKDKLTTYSLAGNDILRSYRLKAETDLPGISQRINYLYDTRTLRLTISRKFGNTKMKSARQRASASETEQGRIRINN